MSNTNRETQGNEPERKPIKTNNFADVVSAYQGNITKILRKLISPHSSFPA